LILEEDLILDVVYFGDWFNLWVLLLFFWAFGDW
jgi:hypothetical protein